MSISLSSLVLRGAHEVGPPDVLARCEDLEGAAAGWWQQARSAWPGVDLAQEAFFPHVGRMLALAPDPARAMANLKASDLYLAHACARGDPTAVVAFEHRVLNRLDRPLRRMGVTMQIREDVRGDLAQDLLVGTTDRPPRLLEYAGRGDLWSWVRVSAVRAALKRRDRAGREIALTHSVLDALARQPGPGTPLPSDPELRAVRQQFRPRFEAAFTEALAALPARERNVLLQHHLDGLTTDQLGALYRVHRVTISRWLIGARGRLLQQTRERLIGAFALTPSECDSVIRLVRSQIDLTLASLAGT